MLYDDERVENEHGAVSVEEEGKDIGAVHTQIVVQRHEKRCCAIEEENKEREGFRVG